MAFLVIRRVGQAETSDSVAELFANANSLNIQEGSQACLISDVLVPSLVVESKRAWAATQMCVFDIFCDLSADSRCCHICSIDCEPVVATAVCVDALRAREVVKSIVTGKEDS